ncbi:hypothetical protein NC652_024318 [Populus alba x Populus x berolinensis]|nr:hypothetical protein NC652_024318 [Populus alba x Populus x berolinensis]
MQGTRLVFQVLFLGGCFAMSIGIDPLDNTLDTSDPLQLERVIVYYYEASCG